MKLNVGWWVGCLLVSSSSLGVLRWWGGRIKREISRGLETSREFLWGQMSEVEYLETGRKKIESK